MKRPIVVASLILIALLAIACSGATTSTVVRESAPNVAPLPPATPAPAGTTLPYAGDAVGNAPSTENRMIIQRVELSLVVKEVEGAASQIRDLVSKAGGYLSNSNLYRDGEQLRGSLTVRVPAKNLTSIIDQFKGLSVRVVRENLSGEDVTEEYTDLGSRLRNLEATEKELLAMLTEVRQRANAKTSDILEVYQQLTEIRGQIEQIKGRMSFLQNLTALATIQIELIPDELSKPVVDEGWQPLVTLRAAFGRLLDALRGLVDLVIWVLIFVLPVLIVIALPFVLVFVVIRAVVRRRQANRVVKTDTTNEK